MCAVTHICSHACIEVSIDLVCLYPSISISLYVRNMPRSYVGIFNNYSYLFYVGRISL